MGHCHALKEQKASYEFHKDTHTHTHTHTLYLKSSETCMTFCLLWNTWRYFKKCFFFLSHSMKVNSNQNSQFGYQQSSKYLLLFFSFFFCKSYFMTSVEEKCIIWTKTKSYRQLFLKLFWCFSVVVTLEFE